VIISSKELKMQPTIHWEGKAEYLLRQYLALCYLLKGSLERMCYKPYRNLQRKFYSESLGRKNCKAFPLLAKMVDAPGKIKRWFIVYCSWRSFYYPTGSKVVGQQTRVKEHL
jgi:hypothetical protein